LPIIAKVKNLEISIFSIDQLPDVASAILKFAGDTKLFAFYAEMGAGKTTLIKELCRQLGSHDNFSSPTYSIVNEYQSASLLSTSDFQLPTLYHIDCYRLKNREEAISIGIEDYIDGSHYCFIEWPELIESLLPADVIKISIRTDGNLRNLSIFKD
jgi:tRNA threonylcarbamoyladenosine biosynthesis protein TsaE